MPVAPGANGKLPSTASYAFEVVALAAVYYLTGLRLRLHRPDI